MTVNGKYYSDPEAAAFIKKLEAKVKRMTELLGYAMEDLDEAEDCDSCLHRSKKCPGAVAVCCYTWKHAEEVKRLIEEEEQPKRCEHYTAGHWFLGDSYGTCHGTREQDPCSCEGDRNKCDYYKEQEGVK